MAVSIGRAAKPYGSPDADPLVRLDPQLVVGGGLEDLVELVEVAHDVGAELRRAVGVDGEVLLLLLLAPLGAPAVGPVEEDLLAVLDARVAVLADQEGLVADGESAEVSDVLADGEGAVDALAGQGARLEAVVLLDEGAALDLEGLAIGLGPPVVEVAGAVVLRAL